MASYVKFNSFAENIAEGVIDLENDTLKVLLTNSAPSASNSVKADLTEISAGNGYTAGGVTASVTSSSQTSGTYKLVLSDVSWTASGGAIAAFRYAVLYSDTPTSPADPLIGYWDNGSTVSLTEGLKFDLDFDATTGVLQIT